MNIEETKNKIDKLLSDRGLTEEGKEQAVRLLLYHLYTAIDIYRFMTFAEKNKAGYWYRVFRSSFSLRGFLKERKRKRDKEKSPLHPSYKERETMLKEKSEKDPPTASDAREVFHQECLKRIGQYDCQQLADFYQFWSEENPETGKMRFQEEKYWNIETRLKRWVKNQYSVADAVAATRMKRLRKKESEVATQQQAIAQERQDDNVRLEQEIEERKRNAVSYNDWLAMKAVKEAENEKKKESDEAG